jgi:hypothetical protein
MNIGVDAYFFHALTHVPVNEGTFRVHEVELVVCGDNKKLYRLIDM